MLIFDFKACFQCFLAIHTIIKRNTNKKFNLKIFLYLMLSSCVDKYHDWSWHDEEDRYMLVYPFPLPVDENNMCAYIWNKLFICDLNIERYFVFCYQQSVACKNLNKNCISYLKYQHENTFLPPRKNEAGY